MVAVREEKEGSIETCIEMHRLTQENLPVAAGVRTDEAAQQKPVQYRDDH